MLKTEFEKAEVQLIAEKTGTMLLVYFTAVIASFALLMSTVVAQTADPGTSKFNSLCKHLLMSHFKLS